MGNVGSYTSLRLDSAGLPRISYNDFTNGDLKYAAYNGTAWTLSTVDSTGNVGFDTSLVLDSADHPWISYYDITNNDLKSSDVRPRALLRRPAARLRAAGAAGAAAG